MSTSGMVEGCRTCASLSGTARISPGPVIYEGTHWIVDHAYPCRMKGWLVLVLKRHAEALHDLTPEEFAELGTLLGRTTELLHRTLDCQKEYVMQIAEGEGFAHVHVHVVPKPRDLPVELKGPQVFALIRADDARVPPSAGAIVPPDELAPFCERLRASFPR